jgi:hypothetical protein
MTIEEFDKMKWKAGMQVRYHCLSKSRTRDVASVNFLEKLIGLASIDEVDEIDWVRCENVTLE